MPRLTRRIGAVCAALTGRAAIAVVVSGLALGAMAGAGWAQQADAAGSDPVEAALTKLLAKQRGLMIKAIDGVAASRPGVPEYFFIGFAGQASEDVFLNEVRAAADLFRRRFGAAGRVLLLANNEQTVDRFPMASISTLRIALNEVAAKMGAEDVLVLYVASHGRRQRISLRYKAINLPDLYAETLRGMLDQARIRNRVLAISACYSGSFIEALADPHTLIMTAAAADRVSFGCGHNGTFTYFGQALIGEALEEDTAFRRAFAKAAQSIERRERAEGLKPSKPQIFVGSAIGEVLDGIEQGLEASP